MRTIDWTEEGRVVELDGEDETLSVEVYRRMEGNRVVKIPVPCDVLQHIAASGFLYEKVDVTISIKKKD
jgi:hypothetical protein